MPASLCDPVSNALHLSLSVDRSSTGDVLDSRLIATAKSVLLTNIDFEETGNYQSNLLEGLKSKYVVIRPKKSTLDIKISKNDASDSSAAGSKHDCRLPTPKNILFATESVILGWTGKDFQVGSGMVNVGNTCYLNSTLQALFHVPAFANWLMSDSQHTNKCNNSEGCIICCMRSTLVATQCSNGPIKPWQVYSKLRLICRHLTPGRQEDAHEFLRYLVEAMEKSFISRYGNLAPQLDQYSKETTPLNQILGGYLRSAVRCLACGHVSTTFQHFQDLLLDIRKAATMEEALDTFFSRERLEDLGYKCESCNKKVSATKQFFIERAPAVLCIALKRFSLGSGKLSRHISYRSNLTLNKYIFHKNKASNLNYRLVALVTHLGPSQNCGHYTAIGRAPNGLFFQFDDSCVRNMPVSTVLATNAYIMFYEIEKNSQNNICNNPIKNATLTPSQEHISRPIVYGPKLPENFFVQRHGSSSRSETEGAAAGNSITFYKKNFNDCIPAETKLIVKNGNVSCNSNGHMTENDTKKGQVHLDRNIPMTVKSINTSHINSVQQNVPRNGEVDTNEFNLNKNSKTFNQTYSRDAIAENGHKKNDRDHPNQKLNTPKYNWEVEPKAGSSVSSEKNTSIHFSIKFNCDRIKRDSKSPSSKTSSRSASSGVSENNSLLDSSVSNSSRLVPYETESSDEDDEMNSKMVRTCAPSHKDSNITSTAQNSWTVSIDRGPKLHSSKPIIINKSDNIQNKEVIKDRLLVDRKAQPGPNTLLGAHQTLSHLHQLSHRGYGAPVQTWNGTKANLTKDMMEEKRFERKRAMNGVDDMDSGRIKKMRTFNKFNRFQKTRYNPFQEKQSRQQNGYWSKESNNFNGNMQDRRSFYHQYPRNNGSNQFRYRHKYHNNYPRHR